MDTSREIIKRFLNLSLLTTLNRANEIVLINYFKAIMIFVVYSTTIQFVDI